MFHYWSHGDDSIRAAREDKPKLAEGTEDGRAAHVDVTSSLPTEVGPNTKTNTGYARSRGDPLTTDNLEKLSIQMSITGMGRSRPEEGSR